MQVIRLLLGFIIIATTSAGLIQDFFRALKSGNFDRNVLNFSDLLNTKFENIPNLKLSPHNNHNNVFMKSARKLSKLIDLKKSSLTTDTPTKTETPTTSETPTTTENLTTTKCTMVDVEVCEEVEEEVCKKVRKCSTIYKPVCRDGDCKEELVDACEEIPEESCKEEWITKCSTIQQEMCEQEWVI